MRNSNVKYYEVIGQPFVCPIKKRKYVLAKCLICGNEKNLREDQINITKSCRSCQFKPIKLNSDEEWCSKCKNVLPKTMFAYRKDGTKRSCKECEKTYREAHKNPDYHKKYNKVYKQNNIEKVLWLSAKKRSSSKGLIFNIEIEDINIPEYCPILGIKIEVNGEKINSPSLDRIDSTKGYEKDNIQVISWRANWLKGNASLEEIKKLGEWASRLS
jgi:hypothetical protein